jgi:signal transduction histidine kinase
LKFNESVIGVMNVAYEYPHDFSADELGILERLADQAAVALRNARIYEYVSSDRRNVQLLYDLTNTLVSTVDQDEILQQAINLTTRALRAASGEVFLIDRVTGKLQLVAHSNRDDVAFDERRRPLYDDVNRGLEAWVVENKSPVRITDTEADPRWVKVEAADPSIMSALSAPITTGDEILGVITLLSEMRMQIAQLDLLASISKQVGLALSNAQKFHQVERRLAELSALQEVAKVVNSRLEMQELLNEVVDQVGEVLGYEIVGLYLVEGELLKWRAGHGLPGEQVQERKLSEGIIGRVARTNEAAFVPDVTTDPDYIVGFLESKSEIVVPLSKGEIVIGVLNVESSEIGGLDENDLRLLLLLADQVLSAIENATLYDRLQVHTSELEQTVEDRTSELAEALDQARVAERLKTQFVADVSHELRTPLANIRLYLELLNFGNPERGKEYLDTLARETDRLVILIEDLLAISRLDTGTAMPNLKAHDLNNLVHRLVEDRQRLFSENSLEIHLEASENLPQVMIDGDMITQAVANLITNSMNYTRPGGSITLHTDLQEADGHNWATLRVVDTGIGIAPEEEARVFERFYRGQAGRRMQVEGTGLGLAISKEILDRHGGRITLKSEVNKGTEFTVWLPLN